MCNSRMLCKCKMLFGLEKPKFRSEKRKGCQKPAVEALFFSSVKMNRDDKMVFKGKVCTRLFLERGAALFFFCLAVLLLRCIRPAFAATEEAQKIFPPLYTPASPPSPLFRAKQSVESGVAQFGTIGVEKEAL